MPPGREPLPPPDRRHGNLTLNRCFLVAIVAILGCSLALGFTLVRHYRQNLIASETSLSRLVAFSEVLEAANRLSAERGPSNAVLGEEPDPEGVSRQRLNRFRARSDAALARAATRLPDMSSTDGLRQLLGAARAEIDRLAALPRAQRSGAEIAAAVEGMFGVFDATQPVIDAAMTEQLASSPELVGRALVARMLSELREHAGRLGSHLVIPMARGEVIGPERHAAFEQTRGRVLELWHLARQPLGSSPDDVVAAAHRAAQERFFGEGMTLLDRVMTNGLAGRFEASTAAFTDAIVPTFGPLETLREGFLGATIAELRDHGAAARRAATLAVIATAVVLGIELLLLAASQSLLFRPLLAARGRILALAAGEIREPIPQRGLPGEIRSLFQALERLRGKLVERDALDRERAILTRELKRRADTDGLTGVLNRGALERLAEQITDGSTEEESRVSLILLDLDRFKHVNDGFGHAAGDLVLTEAARRLRKTLRRDDVIARFGGEEFAVLLIEQPHEPPAEVAERLRAALLAAPFPLPSGGDVTITASFGIAQAEARPGIWPRLVAAADRALYRSKAEGRDRITLADALDRGQR